MIRSFSGRRVSTLAGPLACLMVVALLLGAGCGRRQSGTGPQPSDQPAPIQAGAAPAPGQEGASATPAPGADGQPADAASPTGAPLPGASRYQVVPGESRAAYRATEKFANRELPNEAVGVSTAVEGELLVTADGTLPAARVRVDLRQLNSDAPRRDGRLHTQWLESDRYPWAEFTLAEPVSVAAAAGQPAPVTLAGDLTVKGVRRRVVFTGTVTRTGEILRIQARAQVKMTDFGIDPPNLAGFVKVNDPLVLEGDLVARPGK